MWRLSDKSIHFFALLAITVDSLHLGGKRNALGAKKKGCALPAKS
jgi:hypothetical protein